MIFLRIVLFLSLCSFTYSRGLSLEEVKDELNIGVNAIFKKFGLLECKGLDNVLKTKGTFLEGLFGHHKALGDDLCGPTCGGECIPYDTFGQAPSTISYAFGCKCPQDRCGAEGPKASVDLDNPDLANFKVTCAKDSTCTCAGMISAPSTPNSNHTGYLCGWINVKSNEKVRLGESGKLHPSSLPISWCSCCPDV